MRKLSLPMALFTSVIVGFTVSSKPVKADNSVYELYKGQGKHIYTFGTDAQNTAASCIVPYCDVNRDGSIDYNRNYQNVIRNYPSVVNHAKD